jgi:diacylglycerol kinase (ATP)
MRALLVHNPTAGNGEPTAEALLAALERTGCSATYCSRETDDLDAALAGAADIVIIAGGDGTVARVARKLPSRAIPIAILPIGTANNIARCLGIEGCDAEELIANLGDAAIKRLDIGRAVGPWGTSRFIEAVGFGALAKAIEGAGPKPPLPERIPKGRAAFAQALIETKPKRYVVAADGEEIDAECVFMEVLNVGITGPRVVIGPSAQPGDQLLDVVYLTSDRLPEMLDWLKEDHRPPPVDVRKAREVTMMWECGRLRIDDKVYTEPSTPCAITIGLEPEGLRVHVPDIPKLSQNRAVG